MLEQQATVVAVDGDDVVVHADAVTGGCSSCHVGSTGRCGSGTLARLFQRRPPAPLRLPNSIAAVVGDRVVLGIDEQALLYGALQLYLLPLLTLFGGAVVGDLLLPLRSEIGAVLGAITGLIFGLQGIRYWQQRQPQQRLAPQLLRRLP